MNNPLISVIIPCYNVEKYVAECLESILSQSYQNLEIVVINDGSTDNTEEVIKPFLRDKRIIYKSQNNLGLSEARNSGLRIISGKYVCLIDSDDYIDKDYITILYENLIKYNADISMCDFVYKRENDLFSHNTKKNHKIVINNRIEALELINKDFRYVLAWNKLYKVELFKNLFYKPGKIHEDEFIIHHLLWRIEKLILINEPLYIYRQTSNSIMNSSYTDSKLKNAIEAFNDRICFFHKNKISYINIVYRQKWFTICNRGLFLFNLNYARKYILRHPIEFYTKFKYPFKKKLKLYLKLLFNKL